MKTIISIILAAGFALAPIQAQTERALVDLVTGEVLDYRRDKKPSAPPNPVKWVPVTRGARPGFDPATQKLRRDVVASGSGVSVSWVVVDLSQAELDAKAADAAAESAEATRKAQIAAIIAALEAGTLTDAQHQRVTARIAKYLGIDD